MARRMPQAVPRDLVEQPCLDAGQAVDARAPAAQGRSVFGMPVEIEWALDDGGFKLLQARPLHVEPAAVSRTRSGCSIPACAAIPPASAGALAAPS